MQDFAAIRSLFNKTLFDQSPSYVDGEVALKWAVLFASSTSVSLYTPLKLLEDFSIPIGADDLLSSPGIPVKLQLEVVDVAEGLSGENVAESLQSGLHIRSEAGCCSGFSLGA